MASSSTSFIQESVFKYDVFLSFRGEDTRNTFVGHLYEALKRENIETYKDDMDLEKGKKISNELIQAIEDSRFHVIVFSKNYASSSWCLDELVKIIECQEMRIEQTVYPIFYDVEPTEVRNQSGAFGEAFTKHKKEDVEKWRKALKDAASFSGWDLRTIANGQEADFIKKVVTEISLKLLSISALDDNLVGMRTRIYGVVSSLNTFPNDFCMIGIWGMGGSGKTTLARAVFDQICKEFEGSSFVENVREYSRFPLLGLRSLQQQVLRDVLNRQTITVNGVFDGKKMMKKYMSSRKVLVVLDDVDNIDQLKALVGDPNWFMKGSKIIITTRDKQVLVAHRVNLIHHVSLLTYTEAICLLSKCAFGTEIPNPGYEGLSTKVVSYAAGLPLTITILGSSLYGKNVRDWRDTLDRLKKIPLDGTLQKLELSYICLEEDIKEIFLDVACILKGWKEDEAIRALESCGFNAIHGLSVLKEKYLVTISHDKNLGMHDHIEEMGRHIVRRSHSNDPNQHSRLWIKEEIKDILANNRGTEETKCIKLNLSLSSDKPETVMKGLGNLSKLRFLLVRSFDFNHREFHEGSQFPCSLQYLEWYHYPFRFLPQSFQASNLVVLEMVNSQIEQLWEGGEGKVLDKLRFLQLSGSKLRTLDLGLTPNLEILDLQRCYYLVKLDIPVQCEKLKSLKHSGSKLSTLKFLATLNIHTLNIECDDLVKLDMSSKYPQLKTLNLARCLGLVELDMPCECPQLIILDLESCNNLKKLCMPCECPQLKTLDLFGCEGLLELHMPRECPQLKTLILKGCKKLVELEMPGEYPQLKILELNCPELRSLNINDLVFPRLERLTLSHSKSITLELTLKLKILILIDCDLAELHIPDGDVKLEVLVIESCLKLKTLDLERTTYLSYLDLLACDNLVKLLVPIGVLENLTHSRSFRFNRSIIVDVKGISPMIDMFEMVSVDISKLRHNKKHQEALCYIESRIPH